MRLRAAFADSGSQSAPWGQERHALGIAAASFFREGGDEAEKDRAESPTACRNAIIKTTRLQDYKTTRQQTTDNRQQTTDNGPGAISLMKTRSSEMVGRKVGIYLIN